VDSINKGGGISRKIENLFPFTKISYFRNIHKINSRAFDSVKKNKKLSSKYICFVDSGIQNQDVSVREGKINFQQRKKYYFYLKNLFIHLNKIFKKKVVICLHPKNNDGAIYKNFKKYKIIKYKTTETIRNSYIVLSHDSSATLDAILMKKNIICINSYILGNYWSERVNWYANILGLPSIELNKSYSINKNKLLKEFSLPKTKQKKYILKNLQTDKDKAGARKIIDVINKVYF